MPNLSELVKTNHRSSLQASEYAINIPRTTHQVSMKNHFSQSFITSKNVYVKVLPDNFNQFFMRMSQN